MRALLFASTLAVALCLAPCLPAAAQDGAPVPLTAAGDDMTAIPEGYIPLPEGVEGEVPPLADQAFEEQTTAPATTAAAPSLPPPAADPVAECSESAEIGHDGQPISTQVHACLKDRHAQSEAAMETMAAAAYARAKLRGRQDARTVTGSNLAFAAYRDSECVRQRAGAADDNEALQREWACRAVMNENRSQTLQAQ